MDGYRLFLLSFLIIVFLTIIVLMIINAFWVPSYSAVKYRMDGITTTRNGAAAVDVAVRLDYRAGSTAAQLVTRDEALSKITEVIQGNAPAVNAAWDLVAQKVGNELYALENKSVTGVRVSLEVNDGSSDAHYEYMKGGYGSQDVPVVNGSS